MFNLLNGIGQQINQIGRDGATEKYSSSREPNALRCRKFQPRESSHLSDDAPPKNESWKLKFGTLGGILRGKKATLQREVCVIAYSLLYYGVALGTAAKAQ